MLSVKKCRKRFAWIVLATVSCVCWISVVAMAQSATGLIGNVTDPQGAIVPGVTITLTNKATSATRTTISDERGSFSIPQLSPGTYSIKAELTGFKTVVVEDVAGLDQYDCENRFEIQRSRRH